MVEVYAVNLHQDIDNSLFSSLLPHISSKNRNKIERFKRYEDAERTLLGELLIRYILCTKFNVSNNDIAFFENNYGKPYIHPKFNLQFNISHSGEWIVCAISEYPVGIDIEKIMPIELSIAKNFFSIDEYGALLSQDENNKLKYFYQLWCAKESFIKAVGKGLSISLNSFTINIMNNMYSLKHDLKKLNFFINEYVIDPEYMLVVCSKNEKNNRIVEIVQMTRLINYFEHLSISSSMRRD